MNREIKFRAWTGSEMITPPNVFIGTGSSAEIIEIALDGCVSKRNAFGLDGFSRNPAFDTPETELILMQHTGLKDKNGKEIYEGDILNVTFGYPSTGLSAHKNVEVFFDLDTLQWSLRGGNLKSAAVPLNCYVSGVHEYVGNIYENPELLSA